MRTNLSSQISLNQIPVKYYRPDSELERSALTRNERIHTEIFETAAQGAQVMALKVANIIRDKQQQGVSCVVGLAGGASTAEVYDELVRMSREEGLSFAHVIFVVGYEYYPLPAGEAAGNYAFIEEHFLSKIQYQKCIALDGTVPQQEVSRVCQTFEDEIARCGGMDILILGIGVNGNLMLNESGSQASSATRLMLLGDASRKEAVKAFGSKERVPVGALTMGMRQILSARHLFLAAWGEEKAEIVYRAIEENASEVVPASFLQNHSAAEVYLDLAAAARLTRIQRPWLVTSCEWNNKLIRSAIVWLCGLTGKPILKLTNKDYNEHGLSELLALYGSAYDVNIRVFNDLQHTITGWPGGKPDADDTYRPERAKPFPKRVVIFSPHPDDDVISMGGTLQRLVKQNHEVHVAYQTSGNIAVGDEEVMRFLHFINGFNQLFNGSQDAVICQKYAEIKDYLAHKKASDLDTKDILTIKGLIRRGEARLASAYSGIPLDRVHFLDLPFYETGKIQKNPISEADIEIVLNLLREVKPHQIFVAGDLADPHGTHRVCTDAVFAALDIEKENGAEWLKDCRIWMYRGAWAEWEIEHIEMVVPISPEELRFKRNAILKHASQMESAPFLGNDERLFWQRSEDRNHATAALYQSLGLASYEAMEAFVEYIPL